MASMEELSEALVNAWKAHVASVPPIIDGYESVYIDVDLYAPDGRRLYPSAVYFMRATPSDEESDGCVYRGLMRESDARKLADAGKREEPTRLSFNVEMIPLSLDEGPLTLNGIAALIAAESERRNGNQGKARELLDCVFGGTSSSSMPELKPIQDTKQPERQYDPDTKAARVLTNPALLSEAGAILNVAGMGEKLRGMEVTTAVSLSYDDEDVQMSRPISPYDREVLGAVSTLSVAGNVTISPQQVAKAMGIRNPTRNQVRKVEESIDLQRRIMGRIDYTKEARGRSLSLNGKPVSSFVAEGHLIEARKTEIRTANGREVTGYVLSEPPLLYQHAAVLGQVVSYPQRLLDLGDGYDTDRNLLLKRQLLRRVYQIKNEHNKGGTNRIRFTTDPRHPERTCLLERAGINQKDRDTRKRAIDYVLSILSDLVEQGVIAGFEEVREVKRGGPTVCGATIKIP